MSVNRTLARTWLLKNPHEDVTVSDLITYDNYTSFSNKAYILIGLMAIVTAIVYLVSELSPILLVALGSLILTTLIYQHLYNSRTSPECKKAYKKFKRFQHDFVAVFGNKILVHESFEALNASCRHAIVEMATPDYNRGTREIVEDPTARERCEMALRIGQEGGVLT